MSYRRLFTNLFLGSTLALAVLWWLSLRNLYEFIFTPRIGSGSLLGSFYSATVGLGLYPYDLYRQHFMRACIPASSLNFSKGDLHGPLGRIGLGRVSATGISEAPGHFIYYLELPIWLIYILFLVAAFTLIKLFERVSARRKEKILAEQLAAENLP
jgi:hypothetical protein